MGVTAKTKKRYWRLAGAGLAVALLVVVASVVLERRRFGASDQASLEHIERELAQRFDASAATLGVIASQVLEGRDLVRAAPHDQAAVRALFDKVADHLPAESAGATGITVYDPGGRPLAWAGRVSERPKERVQGPSALFVAPDALGLRLVRIEPVVDERRPTATRLGTIVVEQLLGAARTAPGATERFVVSTSLVAVSLRARFGDSASASPYSFVIPSSDGHLLLEAQVAPADLAAARARWRSWTRGILLGVLGATLLLCAGPMLDARRLARHPRRFLAATLALVVALAGARVVLHRAATATVSSNLGQPIDLLLWALLLVAFVWLTLDLIEQRRVTPSRPRLHGPGPEALAAIVLGYLAAGAINAGLLCAYHRFLQTVVSHTTLDLLHFSLHPLGAARLALGFGLVLLHASVIWGAALVVRLMAILWRHPREPVLQVAAAASWIAGACGGLILAWQLSGDVTLAPLVVALAAVAACGVVLTWPRHRARRASQAARLLALYVALVVPALAMYPSLHAFTTEAKERLIAERYGPQAARLRDDLQDSLSRAREKIDALPSPGAFLVEPADDLASTDVAYQAYQLWSKTDLSTSRLTSAVELYGAEGRLISRFALNLPEYSTISYRAATCEWDIIDEGSPLGSRERHVLRASRGICEGGRQLGTVVVRVMLDYRALPFISSQSPYLESLGAVRQEPAEGAAGRDVEFVLYGWSRALLHVSGTSAWPLPDGVFHRMAGSREPFWDVLRRDGEQFRVYYLSDRGGIYALGYPVLTASGHGVNLVELVTLTFALYVLLLSGATIFNALTSRQAATGRALLREVRSSFYRKLFLAFVLVAVLPVVILAFATRTYFAAQFSAGVEDAAVETALVAQRLVEDYATLQRRQTGALQPLDDSIMVIVGRAIDQAVNLFDDAQLQATSERDLFVSGLLPTRTPADAYRRLVLDSLPTFVGQEQVGDLGYLVAAAPVRAGGRQGIVTVPQTLHRQEIEQQIDELDRRVLSALVLFVLLGAGFGYWVAERIADPVNRLTRATRRIARGDLDARVVSTSSDELRRLVEDFNRMAAELKQQRATLERTQRLEAWAEMARQVAHEIKNPLTPIQLSAEHARRVNVDRGRPLSPMLDSCVNAILTQVKLLRQISEEFSSFASSPTARPEMTSLQQVITQVVEPYRTALSGRVAVDISSSPDLPEITIDRTLFARALTNIIENALHAMPGQGRLAIVSLLSTVEARQPTFDRQSPTALLHTTQNVAQDSGPAHTNHASVVVQIMDTGVGMDQEALDRLFEPYFSTKATGTGLGLTIAKRNIELNRGTIAVESRRGVGTTVTITLPIDGTYLPDS